MRLAVKAEARSLKVTQDTMCISAVTLPATTRLARRGGRGSYCLPLRSDFEGTSKIRPVLFFYASVDSVTECEIRPGVLRLVMMAEKK